MKVQSFGSKNLYSAKLAYPVSRRKTEVFISELENSDIERVNSASKLWKKTGFGKSIIEDFNRKTFFNERPNQKFFIVECPRLSEKKQIKAFGEIEENGYNAYLSMLQSESEFNPKALKGLGSCILYGIVQEAKKEKLKSVSLISHTQAVPFYSKLGFTRLFFCTGDFVLPEINFDKFLKTIEAKYFVKPVQ